MKPRLETTSLKLVGVQGVVRLDGDTGAGVGALYGRLFSNLRQIPDIRRPYRTVGYWHFVADHVRLYFAGIEVDSFSRFKWDYEKGLVAWDVGEATWAIWREKNGEEGTVTGGGICWDWLATTEYSYDCRYIGDFEVYYWRTPGRVPKSAYHEVWLPVVAAEGRG